MMKTLSVAEGDRIVESVKARSIGTTDPTMCLVTIRYYEANALDMWMSWEMVEEMAKVLTRACLAQPGPHTKLLAELERVVIAAEVEEELAAGSNGEAAEADRCAGAGDQHHEQPEAVATEEASA